MHAVRQFYHCFGCGVSGVPADAAGVFAATVPLVLSPAVALDASDLARLALQRIHLVIGQHFRFSAKDVILIEDNVVQ